MSIERRMILEMCGDPTNAFAGGEGRGGEGVGLSPDPNIPSFQCCTLKSKRAGREGLHGDEIR